MRGRAAPFNACAARSMSLLHGAGKAANDRTADLSRNRHHRCEIPIGGDGKACLDHIHSQAVELARHAHFLLDVHAATRRLFAVAKCSVKYSDLGVFHAEFLQRMSHYASQTRQKQSL